MLVQTIYQRRKEAGGAPCISKWFKPDEWVKLNSNLVWLDLWYLKGWNWEVSLQWITMEFETQYDELGGKRGASPGKEECLMLSAGWARGVLMLMEECGIKLRGAKPGQRRLTGVEECLSSGAAIHAEHHQLRRDVHSLDRNRDTPNQGRRGRWEALTGIEELRLGLRSSDGDWRVPIRA